MGKCKRGGEGRLAIGAGAGAGLGRVGEGSRRGQPPQMRLSGVKNDLELIIFRKQQTQKL